MPGPWTLKSFFQNRFFVLTHIFWILVMSGLIFSLVLHNFEFYLVFPVLTDLHWFFTISRARPSWPRGRYPTGWICLNGFLFLASLVMLQTSNWLEWFGRGNLLRYFYNCWPTKASGGKRDNCPNNLIYILLTYKSFSGHTRQLSQQSDSVEGLKIVLYCNFLF